MKFSNVILAAGLFYVLPFKCDSFSPRSILQRTSGSQFVLATNDHFSSCPSNHRREAGFRLPLLDDVIALKSSASGSTDASTTYFSDSDQNKAYIQGLLQNLSAVLDRWIVTGTLTSRQRAYNIIQQIERESLDEELVKQAVRMASRAGCKPLDETELKTDIDKQDDARNRKSLAEERKEWEDMRTSTTTSEISKNMKKKLQQFANEKQELQSKMPSDSGGETKSSPSVVVNTKSKKGSSMSTMNGGNGSNGPMGDAEAKASAIVAKAGAGDAFNGETLGIGGLNDVLSQIRRRVWIPLAAPPQLLSELGINPVRGLLLYGGPGCGKTLLARSIGKILSPMRPITVVSGPEVMDRFVGSSEANLREIFDNPPDIYDTFRIGEKDDGKMLSKVTLHVIIFDEFDAMARSRGGRSGGGSDQGDAGVARDSVVNQMLAKMDGVDPLVVPTLVIGLTNKRTLIEPALLRPGRFEVQIEVPKPRTVAQRVSILNVHMENMFHSGRVHVSDAPEGSAADRTLKESCTTTNHHDVPTYAELLEYIAKKCEGMSGASLAGVARAAASRALERAVCDFSVSTEDCIVTKTDFEGAVQDVIDSASGGETTDIK